PNRAASEEVAVSLNRATKVVLTRAPRLRWRFPAQHWAKAMAPDHNPIRPDHVTLLLGAE
ncbi:MAG TPA: hypothetical protein VJY33_25690, partial [Isosphaeraceae bacterium]|nr:hypothetical protein [Isosphaeraceae bacterium]